MMKKVSYTKWFWVLLSFALTLSLLHAAQDEIKEVQGLDIGQESEKKDTVRLAFQHALARASQDAVELTQEEADSSGLIQEALTKLSQGEEHTIELNPELSANVTLVQIKEILKVISSKNKATQQAYLASREDLFLYKLYRLSEYLLLPESFVELILELITDLLAQKITTEPEPKKASLFNSFVSWGSSLFGSSKRQPEERPAQSAEVCQDQIDYQLAQKLIFKLTYQFFTTVKTLKDSNVVSSVAYSPDGTHIASGSWDTIVRIWNAATGGLVRTLAGHADYVSSVAYSPDGRQIASGSEDETVRIWDARTGRLLHTLSGHTGRVKSVAYSPDGARIASGSWDNTVRIWDARNGTLLRTLVGHKGYVVLVAYSSDGRHIASGSLDHTVRIWDAATGALVHTLEGHTGRVESVAYSPDGKQIASGSWDNTICIWDTTTGKHIGEPLRGHTDIVLSVVYSPDGRQIASGSFDRTVRIWDVRKGILLSRLVGHKGYILSVAYSPDGRHIASGSLDNTVRIWGEPDKQLGARVRNWFSEMYKKQEAEEKTVHRIEPHRSKNFQKDRFVFDDLAREIVIKLENNQELQEEEKHSLREIQVLLAQALEKKTEEDASARPYTAADLPEILQAKTLYEGQRSYLLRLDALIDKVLRGIDPFADASIRAYTSVD